MTEVKSFVGGLLLALALSFGAAATASIIEDLPDAIVCSVKDPTGFLPWEQLVFYVSAHTDDGDTLYKTLTSNPIVLIVAADGVIDGANLADCDDRNIASLIEEGRAFNLSAPARMTE